MRQVGTPISVKPHGFNGPHHVNECLALSLLSKTWMNMTIDEFKGILWRIPLLQLPLAKLFGQCFGVNRTSNPATCSGRLARWSPLSQKRQKGNEREKEIFLAQQSTQVLQPFGNQILQWKSHNFFCFFAWTVDHIELWMFYCYLESLKYIVSYIQTSWFKVY